MKKLTIVALLAFSMVAFASAQSEGMIELESGFDPDPFEVEVVADAYDPIELEVEWGTAEVYYQDAEPHLELVYEAGPFELYLEFFPDDPDADTVLVVVTPDDQFLTNDDNDGLNPGIVVEAPVSGSYLIGIGSWEEGTVPGIFSVSEIGFQNVDAEGGM